MHLLRNEKSVRKQITDYIIFSLVYRFFSALDREFDSFWKHCCVMFKSYYRFQRRSISIRNVVEGSLFTVTTLHSVLMDYDAINLSGKNALSSLFGFQEEI